MICTGSFLSTILTMMNLLKVLQDPRAEAMLFRKSAQVIENLNSHRRPEPWQPLGAPGEIAMLAASNRQPALLPEKSLVWTPTTSRPRLTQSRADLNVQ